jgi:DNA polymerase-3 subunit gamma/tau
VEAVGRASPFTRTYLLEAHPVSLVRNLLTIGFDPEFEDHIGLVDNSKNHALLQTKLSELGHPNTQIKFIKAERPASMAQPVIEAAPEPTKPAPAPVATQKPSAPTATAPAAPAKEKPASVAFSKDDFKNDPLIQKALEVFKGKIVDVRA